MTVTVKGMESAIRNMESLGKNAVPKAKAQAVNKIARKAISASTSRVAREVKAPQKLIRSRATLKRATVKNTEATLRVFRRDLPAIRLGVAQTRLTRGGAVLRVGRHSFPGGFIRLLKNDRWHILRRLGKERYPIEVVKIPLAAPLTEAYQQETRRLMAKEMPAEMAAALKKQLERELKR